MRQPFDNMLERLRRDGYRVTRARKAVMQVLAETNACLRPEEVHARALPLCPSLGIVTVYRTLALLTDLGFVRRIHREDGCQTFARRALEHGHHLVCRRCHQAIEFPGLEGMRDLLQPIGRQTGFTIEDHILELVGLCSDCQAA